jgi:hypothetical protein
LEFGRLLFGVFGGGTKGVRMGVFRLKILMREKLQNDAEKNSWK